MAAPFIGSFMGVVVERLPEGRPLAVSRSRCAHCDRALAVADLVPIMSWIALSGRCRYCRRPIGWLPLATEIGALAVAIWAVLVVPDEVVPASCVLGWTLLCMALIDLRHGLLPDILTLPLLAAGLAVTAVSTPERLTDHALGAAAGWAAFAAIAWAYARIRGREGLGSGDSKLLAAAGAWLGWQALGGVILVAALAALAAAVIRARMVSGKRLDTTDPIAFGPYLCGAIWLAWLYGPVA